MNRPLLFMAAALAIGSGATLALTHAGANSAVKAETVTKAEAAAGELVQVTPVQTATTIDFPICSYLKTQSASESLYPSTWLEEVIGYDTYTITEVVYKLNDSRTAPVSGQTQVKLYMAETSLEVLSADKKLTEGDLTLVADYTLDYAELSGKDVVIPLSTPFVAHKGQSLVIAQSNDPTVRANAYPYWDIYSPDVERGTYYTMYKTDSGSLADIKSSTHQVPQLKLRVVEGELGNEGGNEGDAKDAIMPGSGHWTSDYPFNIGDYDFENSSAIYPASVLDDLTGNLDKYTITEIAYPIQNRPASGTLNITALGATSTDNSLTAEYTGPATTLVANHVVDFSTVSEDVIRIPLTTPMVMEKGQSLILNLYVNKDGITSPISVQNSDFGNGSVNHIYNTMFGMESFYMGSAFAPVFNFKYTEGENEGGNGGNGGAADVVLTESTYNTWCYPVAVNSSADPTAAESIYPAGLLDSKIGLDTYTITEVMYPMLQVPTSGKLRISMFMTTSNLESFQAIIPGSDMTLVSDLVVDFSTVSDKNLTIPLTTPFVMHKGESLVIGCLSEVVDYMTPSPQPEFQDVSMSGEGYYGDHTYYQPWGATSFEECNWSEGNLPGTILHVVEGEGIGGGDTEKIDLAAATLTAPEEKLFTGKTYNFNVRVRNNGNVDVENYTVELFDTNTGNVIATEEVEATLNAGLSATITLSHEFETPGSYTLAGRVIVADDADDTNNVTESVTVEVDALAYKATAIKGNANPVTGNNEVYTVTVANEGTGLLEDYQVSLVLVREGQPDQVVAIETEVPAIEAGKTADVAFDYTFDLAGKYGLKGIVVQGEGEPSETEVLNVTISLDKLSPVIENQFPKWDGFSNDFYSDAIARNEYNSASQCIYPASYFGEHANDYQIQQIGFTVLEEEYTVSPLGIKIYLAQTDLTEFDTENGINLIPAEDFTLVYDGVLATKVSKDEPQTIMLDLQQLFTLESGKGLAVNIVSRAWGKDTFNGTYMLKLAVENTEAPQVAYRYLQNSPNLLDDYDIYGNYPGTLRSSKKLPCLTLGYALEPLPAKVDMAVTGFSLNTTEEIIANETEAAFRVNFENLGTVDCAEEDYTIELLNLNEKENPQILATFDGSRYLAPGGSSFQTVRYVFTATGQYEIAARIVVDNDVDLENNVSAPVVVTVGEPSGVASVLADGTFEYDAVASVLYVNLGKCVVNVADLTGRVIASYALDGAAEINLDLTDGVYVISANGKNLKIRK